MDLASQTRGALIVTQALQCNLIPSQLVGSFTRFIRCNLKGAIEQTKAM